MGGRGVSVAEEDRSEKEICEIIRFHSSCELGTPGAVQLLDSFVSGLKRVTLRNGSELDDVSGDPVTKQRAPSYSRYDTNDTSRESAGFGGAAMLRRR